MIQWKLVFTHFCFHYYPDSQEWISVNHDTLLHFAVPPNWYGAPALEEIATMGEPECKHNWSELAHGKSIQWKGPGEEPYVLTTGGKRWYALYNDQ